MKTLLTILLSAITITGFSQSINGMVTSTGGTLSANGITLDFAGGHNILFNADNSGILFETIVTSGTVGVREHAETMSLSFYPNPTTEYIMTDTDNIKSLSVYNLNGAIVKQNTESSTINVNDLANGTYILVAATKEKTSTFKFIKK